MRRRRGTRFSPYALALSLAILVLGSLLVVLWQWAAGQVDAMAHARDYAAAKTVLAQSVTQVGRSVEAGANSPSLRAHLAAPERDEAWLEDYVRQRFARYAGLDEVYLLNGQGACVFALREKRRAMAQSYIAVEDSAQGLVARAQRGISGATLARPPGAGAVTGAMTDIRVVRGRPAILVAKPVLTGEEAPGSAIGAAPVVVGVTFLDGSLFDELARNVGLEGLHFQSLVPQGGDRAFVDLRSDSGSVIGYLVWRAFEPGSRVLSALAPVSLLVVLLAASIVYLLASRLMRRTRDLEESRSAAQHQALHDPLTGLANRVLFEARLDEALDRCRQEQGSLALLCIDLDRFKQINDTLGHPVGDELIRQVAQRLRAQVRETDIVARMGGDEFSIIINDPQDLEAVESICQRIVGEMECPFALAGAKAYIGASIGVVLAPQDSTLRTELSRRVDIALYAAKSGGRGRHVFFTPEMDADVREREGVIHALRTALHEDPGQFDVHYQPIYCARSGHMVAIEALLRWTHPERGVVGPADFIVHAEESGLILALGELVMRRALMDARIWPELRISVNVSPSQMQDPGFVQGVQALLAEAGVPAERLEMELTETALMGSSADVARAIATLREMGVRCALDDFGTGYSSLSHIRDMAVDRIKIDRSFVEAIETPRGAALVEAIVNLANVNGLKVTAEGVETYRQVRFLRELGCHELQGFVLARPAPAHELDRYLASGGRTVAAVLEYAGNGDRPI